MRKEGKKWKKERKKKSTYKANLSPVGRLLCRLGRLLIGWVIGWVGFLASWLMNLEPPRGLEPTSLMANLVRNIVRVRE